VLVQAFAHHIPSGRTIQENALPTTRQLSNTKCFCSPFCSSGAGKALRAVMMVLQVLFELTVFRRGALQDVKKLVGLDSHYKFLLKHGHFSHGALRISQVTRFSRIIAAVAADAAECSTSLLCSNRQVRIRARFQKNGLLCLSFLHRGLLF